MYKVISCSNGYRIVSYLSGKAQTHSFYSQWLDAVLQCNTLNNWQDKQERLAAKGKTLF